MSQTLVCVRHGETPWSLSGQHTGRADIPLTENGRVQARDAGAALAGETFGLVLTSPLTRAAETAALAGFPDAEPFTDLVEWDYGAYEGQTTTEIRAASPGWTLWRDGVPEGETLVNIGDRADRVIARARSATGRVLVFSHGHFLRVLAARWVGLEPAAGALFVLDPATVSVLGWEREQPVIERWNATGL